MARAALIPSPAPPQVEKLLYSRKDAAYALSLSLRTIDGLIANRVLQPRRHGGRVLIPAAEVKQYAARIVRCDILDPNAPAQPKANVHAAKPTAQPRVGPRTGEGPRSVRAPQGQPHLVVPVLRERQTPS
jgi:excisionase family DNA binding protein